MVEKKKSYVSNQMLALRHEADRGPLHDPHHRIHTDHKWHLLFLLEVRVHTEVTQLALAANLKSVSRGAPGAQTTTDRLVSVHLPLHYGDRLPALCDLASV